MRSCVSEGAGVAVRTPGAPADPRAIACAAAHGIDLAWSRARPIVADDFQSFDLLVCLDHDVMRRLHAMAPIGGADIRALMSFVPGAVAQEVPDPFHGGMADYETAFRLIWQGVDALVDTIA
jgi:protein-tyrosine phosphatase